MNSSCSSAACRSDLALVGSILLDPTGRDWRGEGEQREGMGSRGIDGELQPPEMACGGWGR
jgi:hypothetical protein